MMVVWIKSRHGLYFSSYVRCSLILLMVPRNPFLIYVSFCTPHTQLTEMVSFLIHINVLPHLKHSQTSHSLVPVTSIAPSSASVTSMCQSTSQLCLSGCQKMHMNFYMSALLICLATIVPYQHPLSLFKNLRNKEKINFENKQSMKKKVIVL